MYPRAEVECREIGSIYFVARVPHTTDGREDAIEVMIALEYRFEQMDRDAFVRRNLKTPRWKDECRLARHRFKIFGARHNRVASTVPRAPPP